MISETVILTNPLGLHARPANLFVKECNRYESDIFLRYNGKKNNAKSMLAVLSAGIGQGNEVEIICDGPDEQRALANLTELLAAGLPDC